MTGSEAFDLWAPEHGPWSPWVIPTLFAAFHRTTVAPRPLPSPCPAFPAAQPDTAWIVEAPGAWAVALGLAAAKTGHAPIPVFNINALADESANLAVPVMPLIQSLVAGARERHPSQEGPPAFLLDAGRMGSSSPTPGTFDNRWQTTPQDFPSARLMRERGIRRVAWFPFRTSASNPSAPSDDLAHVLRRWHEDGLEILHVREDTLVLESFTPPKPSFFGWAIARTLVFMGLRRNAAGGFGAIVPDRRTSGG